MSIAPQPNRGPRRVSNYLNVLIVFALLTSLFCTVSPPMAHAGTRVEPSLLQRASSHPNTMFGVIVQKATKDTGVEAEVTRLGGKVTRDLSIVNGFAAQLSGAAIQALAREDGVSWISSDGNM